MGTIWGMALICFVIATVLAVANANGDKFVTDNPGAWMFVFAFAGLVFTCIPLWWGSTPWRRNPNDISQ